MRKLVYCLLFVSGVLSVSCENNDIEEFVQFNSKVVQSIDDFTDLRDNNTYHCIQIGNQIWMTENLRYRLLENSFKGCFTWGEKLASITDYPVPNHIFLATAKEVLYDPQYEKWVKDDKYSKEDPDTGESTLEITAVSMLEQMFFAMEEFGAPQDYVMSTMAEDLPNFYAVFKIKLLKAKDIPEIREQAGYDNFLAAEKENGGYVSKFGFLYSYDAALAAVPEGWRLPTDEDWKKLEMTLGMNGVDVDRIEAWRGKGMATLLNEGGESKFNAQNAGGNVYTRDKEDLYLNKEDSWYYWSSSKYQENDSTAVALIRMSAIHNDKVWRGTSRITNGYRDVLYSVRCVKDAN